VGGGSPMRRALVKTALLAAVWGCGGAEDHGILPDAGTGRCYMSVSVGALTPRAPITLTATGSVDRDGEVAGVESYSWRVSGVGGQELDFTASDPDSRSISFQADVPGVYSVALNGSVGATGCSSSAQNINVMDAEARTVRYRLR